MGVCKTKNELEDHSYYEKVWKSLDYGPPQPPPRPPQRSSSLSGETAPLAEPKVCSVYSKIMNLSRALKNGWSLNGACSESKS